MEVYPEKIRYFIKLEWNSEIEYRAIVQKHSNPHAKTLYSKIASDEKRHRDILVKIMKRLYPGEAVPTAPPKTEEIPGLAAYSTILKAKFRNELEEAYEKIRAHIVWEESAVKAYEEIEQKFSHDKKVAGLFKKLASDEKRHNRELSLLADTIKDTLYKRSTE